MTQLSETMWEAGISFLPLQLILGLVYLEVLRSAVPARKARSFPGGAKGLVVCGGCPRGTEVLALGVFGVKGRAATFTSI